MKNTLLVALLTAFSLNAVAQKAENVKKVAIPKVVEQAFKKDFPTVKKVSWSVEVKDFEAEFNLDGIATSANYDKKGTLLELEKSIKTEQLPTAALNFIKKNYSTYKISEAAKITKENEVVTFEAEITKSGKSFDLIFDAKGHFLKKD